MRSLFVVGLLSAVAAACVAAQDKPVQVRELDLAIGGKAWLRTIITPYDPAHDDATYKVYTHLLDFAGEAPLTKGAGGKYTHHRGLFIGWRETLLPDETRDTWVMQDSYQELMRATGHDTPRQDLLIRWYDKETHAPFIEETRTLHARAGGEGVRIIDFVSRLKSLVGPVQFKGDLQHAGMHLRMADEVADHEDTTTYILPDGAEEHEDDEVVGAWWVCGQFTVHGKRYSVLHMSSPNLQAAPPVYSIRRYGRFGAFFEPSVSGDETLELPFRIVYTEGELSRAACQTLYEQYREEVL